jgi:hypothetical protein
LTRAKFALNQAALCQLRGAQGGLQVQAPSHVVRTFHAIISKSDAAARSQPPAVELFDFEASPSDCRSKPASRSPSPDPLAEWPWAPPVIPVLESPPLAQEPWLPPNPPTPSTSKDMPKSAAQRTGAPSAVAWRVQWKIALDIALLRASLACKPSTSPTDPKWSEVAAHPFLASSKAWAEGAKKAGQPLIPYRGQLR